MRHRLEHHFYDPLVRGANMDGWCLHRTESAPGILVPFDLQGCDPVGLAVGVEVKRVEQVHMARSINWDQLCRDRMHQRGWLWNYAKRGARSLMVLCTEHRVLVVPFENELQLDWPLEQLRTRELNLLTLPNPSGKPVYVGWNQLLLNGL